MMTLFVSKGFVINLFKKLNFLNPTSHIKLSRANAILSKLRDFIDRKGLKSICHAIFGPHLHYFSLVWAQNSNSVKRLFVLQKKSLQIVFAKSLFLLYLKNSTF